MNSYYRLGLMKKQMKDYSKAKTYFRYYAENQNKQKYKDRKQECEREIENINFIEQAMANPVPFSPFNLGDLINDSSYQYLPTLTMDNHLFFTQRENDEEDFYFSKNTAANGEPFVFGQKQKLPPPLNTEANEGAASISPDGRYLYFAKCNTKDGFGSCDIYVSERNGNNWSAPVNLGASVNSSAWDSQPSIASDGRTLFFVSNREGGYGNSDIYYSYLQKDGQWTKARNLGPKINTQGNEMTPFIHPSNTTLFFSSDGHIGMGGQDIFYSKIEDGKFSSPINIGYPVNTEADESCFFVNAQGNYALFASDNLTQNRGKTDIYAFELYEQVRPTKVIVLKGKVLYDDMKTGNSALLEIKNLRNNRIVASTFSDRVTNEYLLALPEGEDYALSVTCSGYLFYSQNFSLSTEDYGQLSEREENILLQSIKEGKSVILENIFFATDSFQLKEESEPELQTILELMLQNPVIKIEISGHTDNEGKDDYNMQLSQKRADAVKTWLVEHGVSSQRIVSKGYGKTKPVSSNETEEGRKLNRRTEFKIIK
ncbi:MAG: OmpA family protein [Bacteroidales bacterium]|nr:OmpA family protein [Bacteroidales bacterium]